MNIPNLPPPDKSKTLEAMLNVIEAAKTIDADLSFNADSRGLNSDGHCRIEAWRVRGLLTALAELDKANSH